MNITIVGPGAIGCLWAYHLAHHGHQVSLWGRENLSKASIQLDQNPPVALAYNQVSELQNADLILLTVKAWQVEEALRPLVSHIHHDSMVMLMHNGMGTANWLQQTLPNNPLLLATTTHGALRVANHAFNHTGVGVTHLGGINTSGRRCSFLAEVLQHSLSDVTWCEDIEQALWNKLAINCAINPLTAKYSIPNGRLADDEYYSHLCNVVKEVHLVMQAEGICIDLAELQNKVDDVVRLTANNLSSMQQDIAHHRRSEIDFITGYLLSRARAHQLELPYNQALYNDIQRLEQTFEQEK
ncbi:2-dehydropantoate 2-reductase [Vibrio agarivorans]|uniref:2-dehydropantoate 2-reductase n=1 Tax=Vibrio agarivorans TaxID=153622 RepID=UPI0025B5FFAA|nr:2-dehydropantoate 2-reductase [Vibrio agarivorans]MDN3661421.1 2-dehydropantoate 2-reductase [Vibrio agarivorans]